MSVRHRQLNRPSQLDNNFGFIKSRPYSLDVEFTTNQSNPISNPYYGEIDHIIPVQVDGTMTVSGGRLLMTPQTTPVLGDQGLYSNSGFRKNGKCIGFQIELTNTTGVSLGLALGTGSSLALTQILAGSGISFFSSGISAFTTNISWSAALEAFAANTIYDVVLHELNPGSLAFIRGGAFSDWVLLWHNEQNSSNAGAYLYNNATTQNTYIDEVKIFDAKGLYSNGVYDFANFTDTSLVSGDTWTSVANGEFEFDFTLNGSPSANDRVVLEYRRQNSTNKLIYFIERNSGNSAWDVDVKVVTAGVESSPSGWTKITGVGSVNGLKVRTNGNRNQFYTRVGTTWAKRGTDITESSFSSQIGVGILAASGTTLTRVTSWERTKLDYGLALNSFMAA